MDVKAVICCLAFGSAGALAQDKTGAYVGGGLGAFDFQEEGEYGIVIDDTALSYKVYGGYRFTDVFAVEGTYTKTDDLSESTTQSISPRTTITYTFRAEYDLLEVRGLAHVKSFFAGIGYWTADLNANEDYREINGGPHGSISFAETESGVSLVLGGQWDLERVGIRVDVEAYEMNIPETRTNTGIDIRDNTEAVFNVGVGVHYRF